MVIELYHKGYDAFPVTGKMNYKYGGEMRWYPASLCRGMPDEKKPLKQQKMNTMDDMELLVCSGPPLIHPTA